MRLKISNAPKAYRVCIANAFPLLKFFSLFIFVMSLLAASPVGSQSVTIHEKNASFEKLLQLIEKQSDYHFIYESGMDALKSRKASIDVTNSSVEEALKQCIENLPVSYAIIQKTITLKAKEKESPPGSFQLVTGTVTDNKDQPIEGVSLKVKNKDMGTATDSKGRFSINLPGANNTVIFSHVGYLSREVAVKGQAVMNVQLQEEPNSLNTVVVVAYGSQRKLDLTGANSSIKSTDIRTQGSGQIEKALQGRAAGVQIESDGGGPGSGVLVQIRGTGSLTNNVPLYIVDGVQVDNIININPSDIASMDILKDASAAALYGSRAANGVVLVTTKSGRKGNTILEYNGYAGIQKVGKTLPVLNAEEWAAVSNAAFAAAGQQGLPIASDPKSLGAGTDWQKLLYRTANIQNHTLSASGGGENYNFAVSGAYLNQDGTAKTTNYQRYNLRIKSELTKGRLKVGESILLSKENQVPLNQTFIQSNGSGNAVSSAPRMIPAFQAYDTGAVGGFGGAYGNVVNLANPLAAVTLDRVKNNTNNSIINLYAELSLIKGLTYRYNMGYTNTTNDYNEYAYPFQIGNSQLGQFLYQSTITQELASRSETSYILQEHTLNYKERFGKHSLNILGGFTYQDTKFSTLYGGKNGMPPGITALDASTDGASIGSNSREYALVSYLGRIVYNFADRYVLTGTIRRDGSSRFGPGYKYGVFPSIAGAWNISNENFFSAVKGPITSLKLRASYGVLGNQNIPDYLFSPAIISGLNYVTGQTPALLPGASQVSFGTPNVKWESAQMLNLGTDISLFNNRLGITADYFIKKNTDVLLQVPLPLSTGASSSSPYVNAGQISNKGIELGLTYTGSSGAFNYQLTGTFTALKNRVDKLGDASQQISGGQPTQGGASTTITQAGYSIGEFYLIKTAGIFQSAAEVNTYKDKNGNLIQPNAQPGDIRFVDANGDGIIDQNDRQYMGSSTPAYSIGFGGNLSWKAFDLSIFFQGTQGNKIYNGFRQDLESMRLLANYAKTTLNAWTPQNTHTNMPRAVINDPNFNDQTSDRFLENGSYLRFKTLQLGYSLPERLVKKMQIHSMRFYASFDNLFTITSYKGYNPDIGRAANVLDRGVDLTNVAYPLARTSLLGLQIIF